MTNYQKARLKELIRRVVLAELDDAMKGGGHPEDMPAIVAELRAAKKALRAFIDKL